MSRFSIVIPAYNEEKFLPRTIGAIRQAEAALGEPVEIVVADNMSTDNTCDVARRLGAVVVQEETRCIGVVRNRGAEVATGPYLIFVDADDRMSENMLIEVRNAMDSGRYIAGGCSKTVYDRESLGIYITHGLLRLGLFVSGISLFLMYTTKEAFQTIGGYDPTRRSGEDFDLAFRLRKLGRKRGQKYMNIKNASLFKSSRKFNEYGDWASFVKPLLAIKVIIGRPEQVHEMWYKERRQPGSTNHFDLPQDLIEVEKLPEAQVENK